MSVWEASISCEPSLSAIKISIIDVTLAEQRIGGI